MQIGNNRFKYAKKPLIYRFLSNIKGFNRFGDSILNKNEIVLRLSRWCARWDCVLTSFISLASPHRARLAHSAARPFPTRPASLGSRGDPLLAGSASMPAHTKKTTVSRLSFWCARRDLKAAHPTTTCRTSACQAVFLHISPPTARRRAGQKSLSQGLSPPFSPSLSKARKQGFTKYTFWYYNVCIFYIVTEVLTCPTQLMYFV